jgi:hypothetical protein
MSKEAEAAHSVLVKAFDTLLTCRPMMHGVSPDTAFAIGEALGALSKARALLGRDIDQAALAAAVSTVRKRRSRAKPDSIVAAPAPDLLRQ